MAIGSAAIMFNVDFVLKGLHISHYFSAIVSADHVQKSKPNPETFLKCAEALHVPRKNALYLKMHLLQRRIYWPVGPTVGRKNPDVL
jgi:beta-phosphoglucomutase-like phosphatase (HAD superfamily)